MRLEAYWPPCSCCRGTAGRYDPFAVHEPRSWVVDFVHKQDRVAFWIEKDPVLFLEIPVEQCQVREQKMGRPDRDFCDTCAER